MQLQQKAIPEGQVYVPMQHPGKDLLPPFQLTRYYSLPQSVADQCFDDYQYDYNGKYAAVYKAGWVDAPVG
jgi:hypothetical protein